MAWQTIISKMCLDRPTRINCIPSEIEGGMRRSTMLKSMVAHMDVNRHGHMAAAHTLVLGGGIDVALDLQRNRKNSRLPFGRVPRLPGVPPLPIRSVGGSLCSTLHGPDFSIFLLEIGDVLKTGIIRQ
jgi:hypothetical protein